MEVMDNQVCYATQIETDPDARHSYMVKEESYDVYKQVVMDAFPEDITEDGIKLSEEIPKQTLCKWAVEGKPQKMEGLFCCTRPVSYTHLVQLLFYYCVEVGSVVPQSFTEPVGIAFHINQISFVCKPINDCTCNEMCIRDRNWDLEMLWGCIQM